ncbi:MAG TPA: sialidase family protein [Flavisolibacter sp.]|jgi:hypothetical protein|nr:sialidase family protein [Flavisolibacter sp.]
MKKTGILLLIVVMVAACNNKQTAEWKTLDPLLVDTTRAECPYLTKNEKGHTVLSWIRMLNDSTTAFCYAETKDGRTFSAPVVIPGTGQIQPHGENLPKIIFKPSGEIFALWGTSNAGPRNKYAGQVFYTRSLDKGRTWTAPGPLVTDTASYDQRYYDVAVLPSGEIAAIWLDNRKTIAKEGSGLYYAVTTPGKGFDQGRLISQPCCQCCRTDLFVDHKGTLHVLYRGIVQDSIRDMVHIMSADGQSFSAPKRISEDNWVIKGCPHTGPAITENKEGLQVAWFTGGRNKGCFYARSQDGGKTFTAADSVSKMGSHPQVAAMDNGSLMIVWDETNVKGTQVNKRIGWQWRTPEGSPVNKTYITGSDGNAEFPVIMPVDQHSALIAYTLNAGNKKRIACLLMTL